MDAGGVKEEVNVHTPPVYWGRINGWSVLATLGSFLAASILALIAGTLWFGDISNKIENTVSRSELESALNPIKARLDESEKFRASRTVATDKSLDEMRTLVAPLAGTVFRLSQLEEKTIELRTATATADKATNERIDRLVSS